MKRVVLVDALGTLVELEPPWEHLARELGVDVDRELVDAVRAEMGYYRAHSHEGRDAASLAALRGRCADVLSGALDRTIDVETMMRSIRFRAFDDAVPGLGGLREAGLPVLCVSNWDCSLPEVLARCGLETLVDGVFTSAEVGARKPDPAVFAPALERAGCRPEEALYVGDTPEEDGIAAAAAAIPFLLLDREGGGDVASLTEVVDHLA